MEVDIQRGLLPDQVRVALANPVLLGVGKLQIKVPNDPRKYQSHFGVRQAALTCKYLADATRHLGSQMRAGWWCLLFANTVPGTKGKGLQCLLVIAREPLVSQPSLGDERIGKGKVLGGAEHGPLPHTDHCSFRHPSVADHVSSDGDNARSGTGDGRIDSQSLVQDCQHVLESLDAQKIHLVF